MGKWYRFGAILLFIGVLLVGIRTCQLANRSESDIAANDESGDQGVEPGLTLKDVTLEQPDENGQLLWRIHGDEVTYSPDQEQANIQNPDGELFQDGTLAYRVKANVGEIVQNGKTVFLRGDIVATGVDSNLVLRGDELEWSPQEDLMIVRDGVTGEHPNLKASANEARLVNQGRQVELTGQIVADTTEEPFMKLQTESLTWLIDEERIEGNDPLKIEHFQAGEIVEWVYGETGEVDLTNAVITLNQNVQAELLELPLKMTTDTLIWRVQDAILEANQPVQINQPERELDISAQRAEMDLNQQIVRLFQNVQVIGKQDQTQLTADRLTWTVPTQEVLAEGNVDYRQAEPPMHLTGPEALGKLEEQTIVVSGGRVITEITPNFP
ncbi:MAG: LPS export ABC transporter periplasmic protein LptC [Leptolyngbyaceae cyanobacterium MO_188.B28]|nr:LPS export ABC transporter periplasmic protein LptC [Leptolyngbyaceae cyanobacterium MO_188.B28]